MAYLLIIDNDKDYALTLAQALQNDGHQVQIETDVPCGLISMKNKPPDLVILNVSFPEDNSEGIKLVRAMRHFEENERLKNVPVIMLSAVSAIFSQALRSRDIDKYWLPVSELLEKPVDLDLLRNKVNWLLQEHKKN